ncbi:MAG: arginine--tRNA ligase [Nitrospiraceae bacterium]|nr:arginine--tRNA ligase [Nitrospiraceae bacterium]
MPQDIVREKVVDALRDALRRAKEHGQLKIDSFPIVTLDPPKRPEWGDLASTVALTLAPAEHRPPGVVAQIIVDNIHRGEQIFERIEIARPGFLNLTIKRDLWLQVLFEIDEQGDGYGRSDLGKGQRVLIEYVSANPTGPLHVGHGRGAAVGHAISNLLTVAGYNVVTEYYINDAGRQVRLLGASVYARYRELHGLAGDVPEDGYHGTYVGELARHIGERLGDRLLTLPAEDAEQRCRVLAGDELLEHIRADLVQFGITFDSWFSETSLVNSGAVDRVLGELRAKKLLFEEDGALWFRSSAFGDDKDRVVRKREGDLTYLATDIAYHQDKLMRGYDALVDVWGADHHGYIPRMQAVVQAYGYPKDRLRVVLVQMVNVTRAGKKVEMSKRTGEFITLREVMDEVGADAAKFFFLMRRSDTQLDFDLELAKQQSAENPVYYVQYAHARLASLFRVAGERGIPIPKPKEADLTCLQDPDEFELIRKLSGYPSLLQSSVETLEPHRVTFYLQELAGLLHTFYYKHRIMPPAMDTEMAEDDLQQHAPQSQTREQVTGERTAARLVLMQQVRTVIRNGLAILGVSAPDRM